jgi:hypothetical protein
MIKYIGRFNLLMITEGFGYIDSIGMTIYDRCPNFNLYFTTNVKDAISKARLFNPEVFIVDEVLRKGAPFWELEAILKESKGQVIYLSETEPYGPEAMSAVTPIIMSKSISADDLEMKLNGVAESLFWRKLAAAGAVRPCR